MILGARKGVFLKGLRLRESNKLHLFSSLGCQALFAIAFTSHNDFTGWECFPHLPDRETESLSRLAICRRSYNWEQPKSGHFLSAILLLYNSVMYTCECPFSHTSPGTWRISEEGILFSMTWAGKGLDWSHLVAMGQGTILEWVRVLSETS